MTTRNDQISNEIGSRFSNVIGSLSILYILLVIFILPNGYKSYCSILFSCILVIAIMAHEGMALFQLKIDRKLLWLILALLASVLVIVAMSPYSKGTLLITTTFLFLMLLLSAFQNGKIGVCRGASLAFYVVALLIVAQTLVGMTTEKPIAFLQSAYDKNYYGVILFLFFCWCWVEKRVLGIAACLISGFFLGSRNYLIMLALFFICELILPRFGAYRRKSSSSLEPFTLCVIFTLMLGSIALFSFWWSESVVGASTVAIGGGWNDSSNAIRFNSDSYALHLIADNPWLLLYGYDNDIIQAMGLVDVSMKTGALTPLDGLFYNGFRVVQPHHLVLNLILKEGLVFSVAYFGILAFVLAPLMRKDNCAYWVPILFACMFMHSLLMSQYLFFFFFILNLTARKGAERREGAILDVMTTNRLTGIPQ